MQQIVHKKFISTPKYLLFRFPKEKQNLFFNVPWQMPWISYINFSIRLPIHTSKLSWLTFTGKRTGSIFSLQFVMSQPISLDSFYTPWKFFWCFQGVQKETSDTKWVKNVTKAYFKPFQHFLRNCKVVLNIKAPTPQNGQTHSNNLSATVDKLFESVWPFCGVNA